jgi:alkylation response protein AidB-like acyl-CoA dehydrogenase
MDVLFSEEQELLRSGVREFLARECPAAAVRQLALAGQGLPDALWKKLADLGWVGLCLPEAYGGGGLGQVELAIVLAEMGRVLLPGPYLGAVVAALAVADGATDAVKKRILPGLAAGERRATLAVLEAGGRWDATGVALEARPAGGGFQLCGAKRFVPDADVADWLVVPARTSASGARGVTLFLVDARAPGLSLQRVETTDLTRRHSEVVFADVAVGPGDVLGEMDAGAPLLDRALDRAKVALCADSCGGAERVLELSVAYARVREQFGRAIGTQQAIQHKCADMLVRVEGAKAATWRAAWCLDEAEPDAHRAACEAKAWVGDAYLRVAGDGIQIHGGLGFTWEQDLHLYYKRAALSSVTCGDGATNRELAARELLG